VNFDRHQLAQVADGFGLGFYLLIVGSLFAVITGSPGLAFFLLILGAVAHVGRAGIEEFVAAGGEGAAVAIDLGAARKRIAARVSRLRQQPAPRRTPAARRRR
jgi:hypothetical protein